MNESSRSCGCTRDVHKASAKVCGNDRSGINDLRAKFGSSTNVFNRLKVRDEVQVRGLWFKLSKVKQ